LAAEGNAERAAIVAGLPKFNPFAKGNEHDVMGLGVFDKEQLVHIGHEKGKHGKRVCGGVTPMMGTQWGFHSKYSGLSLVVNTSHCNFHHRPQYIVSVVTTAAYPHVTGAFNFSGTISVTKAKKGSVEVVVLNPLVPTDELMKIAQQERWQLSWLAGGGTNTGLTAKGKTGWRIHGGLAGRASHLLYVDVRTSSNKFKTVPTYFTSLYAKESEYPCLGAQMVFRPTRMGFRVYIKTDDLLDPMQAEERGWQIAYIGVEGCAQGIEAGSLFKGEKYGCSGSGGSKWSMLYPPRKHDLMEISDVKHGKKSNPNAAYMRLTTVGMKSDVVKTAHTHFPAYAVSLTFANGQTTGINMSNVSNLSKTAQYAQKEKLLLMMGTEDASDQAQVAREVSLVGAASLYIPNSNSTRSKSTKHGQGFEVYLRQWEMRAEDEAKQAPFRSDELSGMWRVNYLAYVGDWDHPCVVDRWGPWDVCSKLCDGGEQARFRRVLQKAMSGGAACPALKQVRKCNAIPCPKLACEVSVWGSWGVCSENCTWVMNGMVITGLQNRTREILRAPISGGKKCPALVQQRNCNIRPCTARSCLMSPWSKWSTCTKSCEGGNHTRTRKILRLPQFDGKACGAITNTSSCNTGKCPPVACETSLWSTWGLCSKSCGSGNHSRYRQVVRKPAFGASACPALTSSSACNTQPCPIDCELSAQSSAKWSKCTANYDTMSGLCGHMSGWTFKRLVIVQKDEYGGKQCPKRVLEQKRCTQHKPCPGEGASSICGGLTRGSQPWREKGGHALSLMVDTTSCSFTTPDRTGNGKKKMGVPQYVASVVGTASDSFFGLVTPTATMTKMTATGFMLTAYYPFMVSMQLLKEANKYKWQVSWVGDSGVNSGISVSGSTGWKQQPGNPKALYVDVDTTSCGFTSGSVPRYFASLHGDAYNWKAFGASVVYKPTATSFRMYVLFPLAVTPEHAEEWRWSVGWVGTSDEVLSMQQEVYSGTALYDSYNGKTSRSKGWIHGNTKLGAPLMYSKVDTAGAGFGRTPAYILSVQVQ
jgi:hypothetical protein